MTTKTTDHVHDLSVSIGAGDVPAEVMAELRAAMVEAAEKAAADLTEAFAHVGIKVYSTVDYDGAREHGC